MSGGPYHTKITGISEDLEAFEGKDWNLYRLDDPKLFDHLRTNISQLIEA